jgi:hypothetical protein
MYLENKTDGYLGKAFMADRSKCFLYTVSFSVRRLCMVLCFFMFMNSDQLWPIYGTLAISSFYFFYIFFSMPHIDYYNNILEMVNELLFIILAYTFFGYHSWKD